jgi:hypothetical protein
MSGRAATKGLRGVKTGSRFDNEGLSGSHTLLARGGDAVFARSGTSGRYPGVVAPRLIAGALKCLPSGLETIRERRFGLRKP